MRETVSGVAEDDHEPDRHLRIRLMIQETVAIGSIECPSVRMDDASQRMFRRINIPQFLEPDTISLGLAIRGQIERPLQNFGEMTTYALRKEGIFRVQFQSWLIKIGRASCRERVCQYV